MRYHSAFEIIGPIMVGPSSSHTAGAVRIGNLARQLLDDEPIQVHFTLMGSFAQTYQGHGTDVALIAGVLGFTTDDPRITDAFSLASDRGLHVQFAKANFGFFHPNTVSINIEGRKRQSQLIASSLGGGKAEVQEMEGLPLKLTGERPTLIIDHHDRPGFLAKISGLLSQEGYNIVRMMVERVEKSGKAITVCELDEVPNPSTLANLRTFADVVEQVRLVYVV